MCMQAVADAARRMLAEEVQAFQHMQIKEHSLARCIDTQNNVD